MAKKKKKKSARKLAKKKNAKLKKAKKKKATFKKKKKLRKISRKKTKKKALKKKKKAKKALKKAAKKPKVKKTRKSPPSMARKTLATAHEHHAEKNVGPEGQAFEGYDAHPAESEERHSSLDTNLSPAPEEQENPEEKVSDTEDRPGEDPDAEDLDNLNH